MHWVQIKLHRSILPKATIHGSSENILPYIAIFCHILPYVTIYCYQRQVKDCTKSSENGLPFFPSYLFSNCKIHLCHHSFRAICPFFAPIISSSNLFHIIFTGSFYVSLYIIFTMKK